VERSGDELFARATLARDQHGRFGIGHAGKTVVKALHNGACPNEVVEPLGSLEGLAQHLHLLLETAVLRRPLQGQGQHVHLDRFGDEVVGPGSDRLDGGFHVSEGGHHDDRNIRPVGHDAPAELDSVDARHPQIGEHHVEALACQRRDACFGRSVPGRLEITQPQIGLEQLAHAPFVVDDQNAWVHRAVSCGR
jgi:hypothetical protein